MLLTSILACSGDYFQLLHTGDLLGHYFTRS